MKLGSRLPQQSDNYFMKQSKVEGKVEKSERKGSVTSPKDLLLRFIEVFLPASKRLEELKLELSNHRLDYFKLFKIIDRSSRGVVGAEDLMDYYQWAGGKGSFDVKDF